MSWTCVFCDIVAGRAPAEVVREWDESIAFVPLDPVCPGHVLVVPREHVNDALYAPYITGQTFMRAAEYAHGIECNLITSCGAAATQTVKHLHVHVVPRRSGDGLKLPWSGQAPGRRI